MTPKVEIWPGRSIVWVTVAGAECDAHNPPSIATGQPAFHVVLCPVQLPPTALFGQVLRDLPHPGQWQEIWISACACVLLKMDMHSGINVLTNVHTLEMNPYFLSAMLLPPQLGTITRNTKCHWISWWISMNTHSPCLVRLSTSITTEHNLKYYTQYKLSMNSILNINVNDCHTYNPN